ncbi:hypothetical protein JVT61DRAFT_6011 [Boletus reticuloceps]|uniref:N-acetyltransferase domain-containing protein n=1 Tax=Boletus reticuloceps TaxID=495285 RepID=A0A8I2YL47_9AGAM|nr:hypothetical protein JVT61DRAFT_6011 [Boletus reticuloceps]
MANIVPAHQALAFHHASHIPQEVWSALWENEAAANVILSFALKAKKLPQGGAHDHLWIAQYDGARNVEFVLSCTRGPVDNYPIFIVPSASFARAIREGMNDQDLDHALLPLVQCLRNEVDPQRVFSVFSIARMTERFAEVFVTQAHADGANDIEALQPPYYDATFTFCTRETLNASLPPPLEDSEGVSIALCRADTSHLEQVKNLCIAFSKTSPPYQLDDARARLEADAMIANEHVWVHSIQRQGQAPEMACLVATTRESNHVTAVTKVFTAAHSRGLGCAPRLLHRVCTEILHSPGEKRVVLYVGNAKEMEPARRLYHKIGFQGLNGPQSQVQPMEGVERWLEIGFQGTALGYW